MSVNARANYVSEQYLNTDNSLELPDYTILDLGATYATKIGGVNTTFRANVNNLTDEKYSVWRYLAITMQLLVVDVPINLASLSISNFY